MQGHSDSPMVCDRVSSSDHRTGDGREINSIVGPYGSDDLHSGKFGGGDALDSDILV